MAVEYWKIIRTMVQMKPSKLLASSGGAIVNRYDMCLPNCFISE